MKKTAFLLSILIAASAFFIPDFKVQAASPYIVSETAVVIEAETGTVLYDKNMNRQMHPASITKIMIWRFKVYLFKCDERLNGTDGGSYEIAHIELNDLLTCNITVVLDSNAYGELSVSAQGIGIKLEALIYEIRVGQTVSKRIKRKVSATNVA